MLNHEAGEAQDLIWGWALPTVGGGSEIAGLCMTPDGGTMVHGTFVSGTLDLDPSAASHFVTTTIGGFLPGSATFIAKYDSTGAFSWGYEYDTDEAFINQMAVTTVGEIVLAIVPLWMSIRHPIHIGRPEAGPQLFALTVQDPFRVPLRCRAFSRPG
ncbi:MAG: hypothetical protein IPI81_05315 [Flavobacteriales bacterium]|nr:hypothetical protein [Flavobacteriales bacterium]